MSTDTERPECERMVAVAPFSQHVGDFVDWLREDQGFVLAKRDEDGDLWPEHPDMTRLLADFYKIDLDKVEQERQALLESLREQQG